MLVLTYIGLRADSLQSILIFEIKNRSPKKVKSIFNLENQPSHFGGISLFWQIERVIFSLNNSYFGKMTVILAIFSINGHFGIGSKMIIGQRCKNTVFDQYYWSIIWLPT